MRRYLESIRGRLVASMLLVFLVGLGGAIALRPFEENRTSSALPGLEVLQEPYQDLSLLVPFGLIAVGLIWLVSGWSLRHLRSASRDAAAIGPENPAARISTRKLPGEVLPLVNAVNGALDRLSQAYAAEQRFVADAAHELRTPLAVLGLRLQRARIEGSVDWSEVEHDMAQVNRLAAQLLDLARKEHMRQGQPATAMLLTNLSRLGREAAAGLLPLAEAAGRNVVVDLPPSLSVRGRADDLRDMLRNLIENALVHGAGEIRVAGELTGEQVILTVSDEGPGVPPGSETSMFERFRKGLAVSKGHGLGLAIVREVALAHHGSVAFVPGPGCTVRVALPSAPKHAPLASASHPGSGASGARQPGAQRAAPECPPSKSRGLTCDGRVIGGTNVNAAATGDYGPKFSAEDCRHLLSGGS